jgi:hypothetical protein
MRKGESEFELRQLEKAKIPVLVVNIFVFVVALACFTICCWIRFDLDFQRWVRELDW